MKSLIVLLSAFIFSTTAFAVDTKLNCHIGEVGLEGEETSVSQSVKIDANGSQAKIVKAGKFFDFVITYNPLAGLARVKIERERIIVTDVLVSIAKGGAIYVASSADGHISSVNCSLLD